jgi:LysR family transcriptional regulator, mexEF-oprN operon transcriptional activator
MLSMHVPQNISASYERDLDLNLLRVFAVVAEEGSVTRAAAKLYVTQPAVSAALRRLATFVRAELFVHQGRGLVLTSRGKELLSSARTHLGPLVAATLAPTKFDPTTSTATFRLGLAESTEGLLLPPFLSLLRSEAPHVQLIVMPVQFRTVEQALLSGSIDLAVSIADDLSRSIERTTLMMAGFVCMYDPRFARVGKTLTEKAYFAHDHVVVSYAGDARGIVEDMLGKSRNVRVSVPTFNYIGDIVEGSPLLATVPEPHAHYLLRAHPKLRTVALPIELEGATVELLWPRARAEDPVSLFMRAKIREVMSAVFPAPAKRSKKNRRRARS